MLLKVYSGRSSASTKIDWRNVCLPCAIATGATIGINFNQWAWSAFEVTSHIVCVSSDESYRSLQGTVCACNTIDEVFHSLFGTRDSTLNMLGALNKIIVCLPMVRYMAFKRVSLAIPFNILKEVKVLLRDGTIFYFSSMIGNESLESTLSILVTREWLDSGFHRGSSYCFFDLHVDQAIVVLIDRTIMWKANFKFRKETSTNSKVATRKQGIVDFI